MDVTGSEAGRVDVGPEAWQLCWDLMLTSLIESGICYFPGDASFEL